ncbi:MAG TPA: amidohydrolase family protein [Chloroflexota bacterium]|nr:amidohydrolase family protein [Chloroflexota bacterium]
MRVIDADAHVEESPATFADPYWDPVFADRRPQVIQARESAYWLIDGRTWPRRTGRGAHHFATPAAVGQQKTRWTASKPDPLESIVLSDVNARIRYNVSEGIDLQVIFPTLFLGYPLAEDMALQNALCRCYNSWTADVCGQRPEALKWVAVVNLGDVPAAVDELLRARELGAIGVLTLGTVGEEKLDNPRFDAFYAQVQDLDLALAVHVGWPSASLGSLYDTVYDSLVLPFTVSMFTGFLDIVAGGVLDRFPRLRACFFEAGCHWIPFLLERMDHYYEMAVERGRWEYHAKRKPSEYVQGGNVYFGFEVEDHLLPQVLEMVGSKQFIYASDIPHGDRLFGSVAYLRDRSDVSDSDKELLLGGNAARYYKL